MTTEPLRLLTIDDDDRLRRSLRAYFEDSGMTVFEADNGIEGLAVFAAQHPDVVLVDLMMPGMNGLAVIEELAKLSPQTPAIVVSGTSDLNDAVEALHRGVWDYVTKPIISLAALEHTVNKCVDRARLIKENERYRLNLEELVVERTQEVARTRLQIIQRLGRAGEYRDNETGMHVIRMSQVSRLLALKAGMSEGDAETLLLAAPMHDVGKIGISDQILLKPGQLTPAEWEIMKSHPQIGADIIGEDPSEIMRLAAIIALTHHEKWDGSGYPKGLRGQNIPLQARVVAIADVFDALTSRRPYKEAWPCEQALDQIRAGTGSHFDPNLVPLFLDIVPEVLAIRQQYQD
ncbi:HD domain-containing phosphohydrolase [uncultured Thiodictyon sp.]|uniref:HD domain-containing phosphohydrolase n=1 Tax=uncultured Thiodictyon sp. TaxID=1846217 RepID=UPI0025E6381E|nr:HD domain-containing phosphohydrolase [uncultured Thiodictyon sp.]